MAGFDLQVKIDADLYHAWEYYFNQINGWWPKDFHTSPKTKRFRVDTFIGGKIYEDYGEGCGLLWGEVIGVDYPYSLQIKGYLPKESGGPGTTFEKYSFIPENGGTIVKYEMDCLGNVSQQSINTLKNNWKMLLERHFLPYCEKREK